MERITLMLVDDEERFLETTAKILERRGLKVLTAASGPAALEVLGSNPVDVVILDVKMPGMDGLDVLREIRLRHPLVEVIMLTGHGTIESAVDGMKSGAFDYLTKPCDIDQLIAKAREAHSRRSAMEDKIRAAQIRTATRSPRQLAREVDGRGEQ